MQQKSKLRQIGADSCVAYAASTTHLPDIEIDLFINCRDDILSVLDPLGGHLDCLG